jgi:two-component system response regulator YesN
VDYNRQLTDIFENIKAGLKKNRSDIRVFCAASQRVTGIDKIPFAYQNAVLVLQKLFYHGFDKVVFYERNFSDPFEPDNSVFEKFTLYLNEQNEEKAIMLIESLCRDIKNHDTTLVNNIKDVFFRLTLELFRESEKRGVFFNEAGDNEEKYLWDVISNFLTLEDIRNYLINKISFVFKGFKELESCNRTVFEVRKFIQKNYDDENLSIVALAEHVYLTPTYLSSMFKKSTGKTISEYIIEVRIEKSKEYLMDSKMKLYEVARKVGYNDPNYYAKVFKKLVGFTPSEYREKYLL